jgi:hypothetical protein
LSLGDARGTRISLATTPTIPIRAAPSTDPE